MNNLVQLFFITQFWFFGLLRIRNPWPWVEAQNLQVTGYLHPISLVSALLTAYPVLIIFDLFAKNEVSKITQSHMLSRQIVYVSTYLGFYLSSVVIRLVLWKRAHQLFHFIRNVENNLTKLKELQTGGFHHRKFLTDKFAYGILTFFTVVYGYGTVVRKWLLILCPDSIQFEMIASQNKTNLDFTLRESFMFLMEEPEKIINLFEDYCVNSVYWFALIFIVFYGVTLIEIHEKISQQLVQKWQRKTDNTLGLDGFKIVPTSSRYSMSLTEICIQFQELMECFREYSNVAGYLSFAIVSVGCLSFINVGISFAIEGVNARFKSLHIVFWIASFFIVASVGEFLAKKIKRNEETLESIMGRSDRIQNVSLNDLERVSRWFINWKFSLTAKNLFPIDHSIICSVLGTTMTTFIFIFQLVLRENNEE